MSPQEKILQDLVALDTQKDNREIIRSAHTYVKNQLSNLPLSVKTFDDDGKPISVFTSQETFEPLIFFVCHIDVLPAPKSMLNMHVTPEGRLLGRGTWDMKFALAGIICLMQDIGHNLSDYNFGLAITSDEETDNHNMRYILEKGYKPHCVIILDGGQDWQLESGAKGCWTVKVVATGESAHGSRPWEGDSATLKIIRALSHFQLYFQKQGPTTPTLNVSIIKGGDAPNKIPDYAEAILDIRYITPQDLTDIRTYIKTFCSQHQLRLNTLVEIAPIKHDLNNPYLLQYNKIISELTGKIAKPTLSQGASDAAICLEYDIPTIVTRPVGGGHHTNNEWLDRKSYSLFPQIFKPYIKTMAHKNSS